MNDKWTNKLYYGDNFKILRNHIQSESVDLIYLDPPFNSKATYNILFQEKNGSAPAAQVKAFEDFWHWDEEAERTYSNVVQNGPQKLSDLLQALRTFLGQNDMMAYLTMMAPRLVELYRVLKQTGSIYLHCDITASHYIKILMDSIFNYRNFNNEIIWCYTRPSGTQKRFPRTHDTLLFYSKTNNYFFNANKIRIPYDKETLARSNRNPGTKSAMGIKGKDRLNPLGKIPESWWEIPIIQGNSRERLGFPTQKPEALLERIINASSKENDLILDPFCGCGTTIAVAERLRRKWIGIDITHLAIALMKNRLESAFGNQLSPYEIIGDPKDLASAQALADQDKYQFQWWALSLIEARPAGEKKKGADQGIDGYIYFFDDNSGKAKKIIVQVKAGHVTVSQIRDLKGVMEREKAEIGAFITLLEPTEPMKQEAWAAGFYEPEMFRGAQKFPRVQILTIEELLNGKELQYPRMMVDTFKKAEKKKKSGDKQLEIF